MNIKSHVKTSESYKQNHNREKIEILYKDNHIVVIYKPEGILSVLIPEAKTKLLSLFWKICCAKRELQTLIINLMLFIDLTVIRAA